MACYRGGGQVLWWRSFTPTETSMGSAIFIIAQGHAEFQWRIDSPAASTEQRITAGRFPYVSFLRMQEAIQIKDSKETTPFSNRFEEAQIDDKSLAGNLLFPDINTSSFKENVIVL